MRKTLIFALIITSVFLPACDIDDLCHCDDGGYVPSGVVVDGSCKYDVMYCYGVAVDNDLNYTIVLGWVADFDAGVEFYHAQMAVETDSGWMWVFRRDGYVEFLADFDGFVPDGRKMDIDEFMDHLSNEWLGSGDWHRPIGG